jgi:hypothetical protein
VKTYQKAVDTADKVDEAQADGNQLLESVEIQEEEIRVNKLN